MPLTTSTKSDSKKLAARSTATGEAPVPANTKPASPKIAVIGIDLGKNTFHVSDNLCRTLASRSTTLG